MDFTISDLAAYLPVEVDLAEMLQFILIFAVGSLVMGFLGRVALGKRSDLNHAVSSAMGILFIYAVTIVVYAFNPKDLARFLSPLPFVNFSGEYLYVFSFLEADLPAICSQILSMVILAFLVNLLDSLIPKGKGIVSWYLFRFLTVLCAMALHFLVTWAFAAFLPGVLVTYAPMILLGILAAMLLLGLAKILLGLMLTAVNPILGAIYTFFFSNLIGKQISKAVLTTILLSILVFALEYFGYLMICVASTALAAYIPLILVLLVLWYLLGHVL